MTDRSNGRRKIFCTTLINTKTKHLATDATPHPPQISMLMFEGCGLINVVGSFDVAYNLHVLTTLRSGGAGALLKLCRIFSVYGHHFHVQHQDLKRTATKLMQFLNASDPLHCIDMFFVQRSCCLRISNACVCSRHSTLLQ